MANAVPIKQSPAGVPNARAGIPVLKALKHPLRAYFYLYYWLKARILRVIVGPEALAYVLHNSLFPDIVLKLGGAKIGTDVRVQRWLKLHETKGTFRNLEIGDGVFIGKNVVIDLTDKVRIGNRCGIGTNVTLITHANLGRNMLSQLYPASTASVEIMDDCDIGWACVVNKGTRMMGRVVLLPGTVVTGLLQADSTFGGNPARRMPRGSQEGTQPVGPTANRSLVGQSERDSNLI